MSGSQPQLSAYPHTKSKQTVLLLFAAVLMCATVSTAALGQDNETSGHTRFKTAIAIPGQPLRSFDISWADADRGLYFLGDRSNAGVDIISTRTNTVIGRAGGFVGIVLNPAGTAVNNNLSGPDGVVSRGNCLYGGDGNSTLRVYDITDPTNPKLVGSPISTGGHTRLDEMALSSDGTFLIAANNAEDPPFATLFTLSADGGCAPNGPGVQITVVNSVIPAGQGLSIEQPTWVDATKTFMVSVPTIAENPPGCSYGTRTRAHLPAVAPSW